MEMWLSYFVEEERSIENAVITDDYWCLYGEHIIVFLDTTNGQIFLSTKQGREVTQYIDTHFRNFMYLHLIGIYDILIKL